MQIELKIILGNDLPIKDVFSSDPYIVFESNGKKYKTKVISNTCHPRWKEKFTITASVGETIQFKLFDRDLTSRDDKMGICEWNVPQLPNGRKPFRR